MTSTRRGSAAVLGAAARRALQAEGKQSAVTDDQSSMSSIDGWEQLAGRTKTDVAKLFRKVGRRAREAARRAHPENDAKSDTDANAGSGSTDSQKAIVSWKPKSLGDNEWGSQLTGKAVADLHQDLIGLPIIVTTSKGDSWEARITEVVSRSEKTDAPIYQECEGEHYGEVCSRGTEGPRFARIAFTTHGQPRPSTR